MSGLRIHNTAEVSEKADIGEGTFVWNNAQIREGAKIGRNCIISKNVYIDFKVEIGDNVKIQNNVSVYHGVKIGDGVFIGPNVCLINDKHPRAINPDGSSKKESDWTVSETKVKKDASIGAGSIILPGVVIGEFSIIGAGSIVTKDVPDHVLVYGNPATEKGYICVCGNKLNENMVCDICGFSLKDKSK